MKTRLMSILLLASTPAFAHHGVASLGVAGVDGPGAPVETSSSATLPEGKWLAYLKVDHARSRTGIAAPPEGDFNQYWMAGLGYGFKPWFSAYLFQPYNIKVDQPGGTDSRGFTDLSLMGVIGFKYDEGLRLVPAGESLDDLMDWHFTAYAGVSLPTGEASHVLSDGSIDPGKSLGFGEPGFSYGLTASRQFTDRATAVFEVGQIIFQKHAYDAAPASPAQTMAFGTETRLNAALAYRLLTAPERGFRLDVNLEANFLRLGKDVADGVADDASGGDILYGVVGVRLYQDNMSLGLALKKPIRTRLNEPPGSPQQGAEGKEKYRIIATFSALF